MPPTGSRKRRYQPAGTRVLFHERAYNCVMSNVELVVGEAGVGKTREIVSRLAGFYEANPFGEALALVPTIRHGDQLRKRLVTERSVALNLRVETIAAFSRKALTREAVLSRSSADDLLADVARRAVSTGGAAYFKPIVETGGFLTLISDAIGSLMEEEIEADVFERAATGSGLLTVTGVGGNICGLCR